MGNKTNTTTTSTAPAPQAMQAYQNLLTQAGEVAGTPYTPYGGQYVAPFTGQQNAAVSNINANWNYAQPFIQTAQGMAMNAASPITAAQISQYMSPYTQDVVNATQAQFNNQNVQQQEGVVGNAIAQGALGGNRSAIAQAETANQENLAQAPVIAGLENQGYTTGLNTALTEQQALAAGAYSMGNLGVSGQNAALTGANAQFGVGTAQQQTQQAQDTAQYQAWLNQLAFPYQQTQWQAGIDTGVGSQMGGTGTTTGPAPSLASQIGGLGLGALGLFGSTGAASGIGSGLSSLAALLPAIATGGRVSERARGGIVADSDAQTVPETHATLLAQQKQLLDGHRRVQMFPRGTQELFLPRGISRIVVDGDVLHYDPSRISAEQIKHAIANGRENELLDLGPVSKHEVMQRLHHGEHPVVVVERQPDGTEVRAAAGTHVTAPHQMAAMHRTKSPGNSLHLEDPRFTLAMRHGRAMGGVVPGFDGGGGVNYQTFGGGFGTPAMPYGGGKGWVPTMGISHGQGVGGAPSVHGGMQPQQQSSAQQMGQQIGALAKSINGNQNQNPGGPFSVGQSVNGAIGPSSYGIAPADVSAFPSNWGTGGSGVSGIDTGAPIGVVGGAGDMVVPTAHRGGSIGRYASGGIANLPMSNRIMMPRGYADGGMPDIQFDPTLGGISPDQSSFDSRFSGVDPDTSVYLKTGDSKGFAPTGVVPADVPLPKERPSPSFADRASGDFDAGTFAPTPSGIVPVNNQGVNGAEAPLGPKDVPLSPLTSSGFADETPITPAQESGVVPSGNLPRGIRNNNPGNIEDGEFARSQPGYAGSDGRFAIFKTPEAGAQASGNLLGAYGSKGINTISGIINRWAPAADNNNTAAYIGAVSKMTGIPPNQPLDMSDPNVRMKIAGAIHQYENGVGTVPRDTMLAQNYNRAAGVPISDAALPPGATPVGYTPPAAAPSGGIDWSGNSKLWPALMAAGFGMMASRSPFPGVAIGEGAMTGMQQYAAEKAQEMSQAKIDNEAKRLANEADYQQKRLALETLPYQGVLTAEQKATLAQKEKELQAKMMEPKPFYNTDTGQMDYTVRTPEGDVVALGTGKIIVGPHRGQVIPNPDAAGGLNQGTQPGQPNQQQPGFQETAFHPDGVWKVNSQQAEGPIDYSNGSKLPYIEHGMAVADPAPVAGYSPDTVKTAAEWYLKTGKQPLISRGASPVAQMQNSYARAVMNYGNAVAASRGISREELTDIWQTAPRVGQFILGQPGQQIVSLGTAMRHLETLKDYEDAWQKAKLGDTRPLNALQAYIKTQWGSDAATNLNTVSHIIGPEIIKAIGVAGAGTDKDRADAAAQFTSSGSEQQVKGAIQATEQLLRGQLIGKENQARAAGLSEDRLRKMIGDREYQELSNLERHYSGANPATPATQGTPSAAATAPALPPGIPPGSRSGTRKSDGVAVWQTPDGRIIPKAQ